MNALQEILDEHPLLSRLDPQARERLLQASSVRELVPAQAIARESSLAGCCFLLLDGQARVTRTGPDGAQEELARLQAGSLFGLVGLLGEGARPCTYAALGPCRVLEVSADVLHAEPQTQDARAALALREVLALALQSQLRVANQHLVNRAALLREATGDWEEGERDSGTQGGWKAPE